MRTLLFLIILTVSSVTFAQKVTIKAVDRPVSEVFREIISQTGKNFVYSSDLLQGMTVTVDVNAKPMKKVLNEIFKGTDIEYKIKGNNIILKRRIAKRETPRMVNFVAGPEQTKGSTMLQEVLVVSRLDAPAVETAEIGARKVTGDEVRNTPVLFGEADVIKSLQMQPGVTEGTEGMAGMNVHGGEADENLYMLDNVPLYQVNHFAGLFSAFNTDIIRYIDFFKSSMPAKYDGRLSSFMDVRLKNGNTDGHHGTARLGLTSGAFNISGPIGGKTTYLVGLRRSWYDILTIPMLAIINSKQEENIRLHYNFTDLNAKVTHRFTDKATGFVSIYFGDDMVNTGTKDAYFDSWDFFGSAVDDKYDFHWSNIVAQTGLNYRFTPKITAEFTAAYTRYFSKMESGEVAKSKDNYGMELSQNHVNTENNINDWIFRGDFDWQPNDNSRVRFGAGYVRHSFLPSKTERMTVVDNTTFVSKDSTWAYRANEVNVYIEDDWRVNDKFRLNAGLHASLFNIDRKNKYGLSPRVSVAWRPVSDFAFKAAYSRTVQYVHQLTTSYLALPTDQWIPVTGNFKPQTADKIVIGAYWKTADKMYSVSVEGYYKWLHNIIDYRDEYYLKPPLEMWNARLCAGRGTSKGIDFKVERQFGKVTGHISYSLAWTDRTFADKNAGKTYPARFDNRHTVNILINWKVSDKVQLNAAWIGHSGNRCTLTTQTWKMSEFGKPGESVNYGVPLRTPLNNYQLPFYHRLDLSCVVKNRRGYWTFGLYNAYNHLNTIGVRRGFKETEESTEYGSYYESKPVLQKIKLLPIIPSISYTWQF